MTGKLTDDDVDEALQAWARDSLRSTTPASYGVATRSPGGSRPGSRRPVVLVVASAAVVLLVVALGVTLRSGHGDPSGSSLPDPQRSAAVASPPCPARMPANRTATPSTARPGLFVRPVAAMTACSYARAGRAGASLLMTVPLEPSIASRLVQQLEHAPRAESDTLLCLRPVPFSLLVARDSGGRTLTPVHVLPGCTYTEFNTPTASRYLPYRDAALLAVSREVTDALPTGGQAPTRSPG